jgi:hypothetical protein
LFKNIQFRNQHNQTVLSFLFRSDNLNPRSLPAKQLFVPYIKKSPKKIVDVVTSQC